MTQQDVYSSAFFVLELDGAKVGSIRNVDGGNIKADVLSYQHGAGGETWRQLGRTKYEDIKVTTGLVAGGDLWKWINKCMSGAPERRTGAISAADYEYKEKARREFTDALIAEVAFPKFDASDKNPANVVVTISPEKMTYGKGSGSVIDHADATEQRQKSVSCCNFEFVLDGFAAASKRINKVDGFSIKCKIIEHQVSSRIENVKVPGKIEYPNISFYVPEIDVEPFLKHHTTNAMEGKHAKPIPAARLTFHNNARQNKGTITFKECTIFAITQDKLEATTEDIRMVKVEMAIEGMEFSVS